MKPVFHPYLVNPPFEDPCLYVKLLWEKRALLFDLGRLDRISSGKLLKVSHVFVSHTHIDHFIGFDILLRVSLRKEAPLTLFGPPGMISNVEGKIRAYTWNLIEEYPITIHVHEVGMDSIRRASFRASRSFRREEEGSSPFEGLILEEPLFEVRTVHLNHRTTSLAFSLKEKKHINVRKDALERMGLSVGPWLKGFKDLIREGRMEEAVEAPLKGGGARRFLVKDLCREVVLISEGQKISYVVDALFDERNVERIVDLVRGSDILFCEAPFLERDREMAQERCHLTARQAGTIARLAGVKRLELFHFSPRYKDEEEEIVREAMEAFKGVGAIF